MCIAILAMIGMPYALAQTTTRGYLKRRRFNYLSPPPLEFVCIKAKLDVLLSPGPRVFSLDPN